jgi:hypothetical protein
LNSYNTYYIYSLPLYPYIPLNAFLIPFLKLEKIMLNKLPRGGFEAVKWGVFRGVFGAGKYGVYG